MAHSWGPGIFWLRFQGSSTVSVSLRSGSGLYFVCSVDGQPTFRRSHTSGAFTIATSLDMSEHIVWCGRSNEASYGETVLEAVLLDDGAELLQAPAAKASELRFEAIGDSITAGFATKWLPGQARGATLENSDVFDTYSRFLADGWSTSEWHVAARSGIAAFPYASYEKPMSQQWTCKRYVFAPTACPEQWSFDWQADVVTINLGTNDFVFGTPTDQQFKDAYKTLIGLVREKHPDALIMCLNPLIDSCSAESKWTRMRQNIQAAVQETNDEKVKFYDTGSDSSPWIDCPTDYSDYTHPTTAGNKKFADRLLEILTPDIRKAFPSKCGGTGSRCEAGESPPLSTSAPTSTSTTIEGTTTATVQVPSTSTPNQPACVPLGDPQATWCDMDKYIEWCAARRSDSCTRWCKSSVQAPTPVPTPSPSPTPVPTPSPSPTPVPSPVSPVPSPSPSCANTANSQCGGQGFSGDVCCPEGHYCKELNAWWSQCYSCEYFPDPACQGSLLSKSARLRKAASRKRSFMGTALIQDASVLGPASIVTSDEL
eukprot:TRINITY_DN1339_c0_g1_i1.p1 TRINITY_DN1339_c0_g1~~TRINITY_DN1339_c0_g1_i1.p1  ORF type:complete len:605 (-),score=79.24 TRINITY_DN1339_c0_g1_i1:73-1695(-)